MQSLASIGVTLLLFMIGLELKISELKSVGRPALIAGGSQVLLVSSAAFLLSKFLGFSTPAAFYIALGLSFSSTIVVIKLLSDKKDLNSLYGKLVTGILVVQDIFAIFLLIFLSAVGGAGSVGDINFNELLLVGLKVAVLFGWVIILSRELL